MYWRTLPRLARIAPDAAHDIYSIVIDSYRAGHGFTNERE
jgi:hypothetical protein